MLDYAKKSYNTKENPFKYLYEKRVSDRDGLIILILACTALIAFTTIYSHRIDQGFKTHTVSQWDYQGNLQSSNIGKLIQAH